MEPPRNPQTTTLVQPTELRVLEEGGGGPVLLAELSYDCRYPYAVSLVLGGEVGPRRFFFARELLAQGVHEATGEGEVLVLPGESEDGDAMVVIEVSAGDELLLGVDRIDVEDFLAMSNRMVPPGHESEHLDIDGTIAAILATGGA